MLLENRAPGDASTSDGPSSRTSCALRGLRWPGTHALLIRMVWLMEERWRSAGFGRGTGGGGTANTPASPSPPQAWESEFERLWDRRMWQPSSAEDHGTERVDHQSHSGCFLWLSHGCLTFDLIPHKSVSGLSREHIDGARMHKLVVFKWWFTTWRLFTGLFWQFYNSKCNLN